MNEKRLSNTNTVYLTPQETETLKHLALGLQNKEIAYQMGLSVSTIKQHVSGILLRLNVNTRTAAVVTAQKLGLIDKE